MGASIVLLVVFVLFLLAFGIACIAAPRFVQRIAIKWCGPGLKVQSLREFAQSYVRSHRYLLHVRFVGAGCLFMALVLIAGLLFG